MAAVATQTGGRTGHEVIFSGTIGSPQRGIRPTGQHPRRSLRLPVGSTTSPRKGVRVVAGKFVIKKGTTGKFRFNLLAGNGQVVASSEAYNSKAAAMGGIRSIQKLAGEASIEDQTTKQWAADEAARKTAAAAKKASAASRAKAAKTPRAAKKS